MCVLITLYFVGYAQQYFIFNLFLTKLAGNKFVNASIFGFTESLSVFLSGYLLKRLPDMTVFYIIFVASSIAYIPLIFFPSTSVVLIYLANCLFVSSMGGMQNAGYLMSELRVPP